MRPIIKLCKLFWFVGYVLVELVLASLRIAWDVVTPRAYRDPAIIAVSLPEASAGEIALIANLITFTPGSLSLDLSPDRRTLYVHCMFARDPDAVRRSIERGFVHRILELLR